MGDLYLLIQITQIVSSILILSAVLRKQCFLGTIGSEFRKIDNFHPFPVGNDDAFVTETEKPSGSVDPADGQNVRDVFLGEIDHTGRVVFGILAEQVQEVAQLQERRIVLLMRALIDEQVDIGGVPVDDPPAKSRGSIHHGEEIGFGKGERLHIQERPGHNGLLDLELQPVGNRKDGSCPVEGLDLLGAVFVLYQCLGDAGLEVEHAGEGLPGRPEKGTFGEHFFFVGTF